MDAKVLLKSKLELRVPVEHDHWVPSLNYRVHLDDENADSDQNQFDNLENINIIISEEEKRIIDKV